MPDPATMWSLAGTVASGLGSVFGQGQANRANREMAREQMRFQERMSSTAVQRAVEDYRAAGLNPALAYGQVASSPGGASSDARDVMTPGINSAMAARAQAAQLKLLQEQTEKTRQERRTAEVTQRIATNTEQERTQTELASLRQVRALQPHDLSIRKLEEMMMQYSRAGLTRAALSKIVPWLSANVPEGLKPGRGPSMKFQEALPSRSPWLGGEPRVPNEFYNYRPR